MKVADVMQRGTRVCSPGHDLASVGTLMFEIHCDALPVLGDNEKVVGMITDRDICLAVATRDRKPSRLLVRHAMSDELYSCAIDDELEDALAVMARHRVRRLPAVDDEGYLQGILALDDVIKQARGQPPDGFDTALLERIAQTVEAIGAHPAAGPGT